MPAIRQKPTHPSIGHFRDQLTEGRLLIPGWTYRIEALYMDLGTLSNSVSGGQIITHTHFTDSILRAGLNYQFH